MHLTRRLLAAVVLAVCSLWCLPASASIPAVSAPGPLADFQTQLALASMHAPGHVAIAVEDVATGFETGVNAGLEMPAASTIKIPVMVEVFRQLAAGTFDLNDKVHLTAADRDWGYGDLCDAPGGKGYTIAQLLALMIDVSDNTATNMLIRYVGRQRINATMRELGLSHTHLADFIRSDGDGIRWALRSSPADMARLLTEMAKEQLVDEWSSRAMIRILRGQKHNSLLPQPLPSGTAIAHKTGTLHDTLNDVGIVYLGEEPYVIAVMTTDLPTLDAGRSFIRGVSRMAYNALGRFASWREEYRVPGLPAAAASDAAPATPDQRMWTPAQAAPAAPVQPAQPVLPSAEALANGAPQTP